MGRVFAVIGLATACGRVSFDTRNDAASGDATDAVTLDTFDPSVVPWRTPARVLTELESGTDEQAPSVTADRLMIAWMSLRSGGVGGGDIHIATRNSVSEPFGNITNPPGLNSVMDDDSPELSPDGSRMYFYSNRSSSGDIYVTTRSGTTWSAPTLVTELSSANFDGDLALTPDELTVIMVRGTGFFRATRTTPASAFGPLTAVTELSTDTSNASPTLGEGGRVIYFHNGPSATRDLVVARLAGATYSPPQVVSELQTAGREADPFITADERFMYFNCGASICETTKP